MISSEDVRRVTFEKAFQGYRRDDVDDYLKQVAQSMDELAAQNDDLQKKLVVLAQRIDQYRAEEDTLRTTMINAQRLGENVIREAKQKAAEIIRTANIKAEDREQRSRDDVELAKQEIVTLKSEADSFKRSLIEMYRKHINLINKLPDYTPQPEDAPARPSSLRLSLCRHRFRRQPRLSSLSWRRNLLIHRPPPSLRPSLPRPRCRRRHTMRSLPRSLQPSRCALRRKRWIQWSLPSRPTPRKRRNRPGARNGAPAIDETRFQDVSGLYDEPEAKPVRRTRKTALRPNAPPAKK